MVRGFFKRSGCIDQYSPSLKSHATAHAAEQHVNNEI